LTSWLIIRTDYRKEHYVAAQIRNMGFAAWVPCQMISTRLGIGRRKLSAPAVAIRELPVLPRRLFAAVPMWAVYQHELDGIRHCQGFEQNADQMVVQIPDNQITAFRAEIDRENTAALALMQARNSRKQKAKWRSLKDALVEMVESAKTQMEQAA
jgi:hypothetical protein